MAALTCAARVLPWMSAHRKTDAVARRVSQFDARVEKAVKPYEDTPLVSLLCSASKMADQPRLRMISAACVAAGLLNGDGRLRRAGVRMLLAHEAATLAKNLVKDQVNRTRPRSATSDRERKPRPGESRDKELSSFPSGHTAGVTAVALAFSREFPGYRTPAIAAAGLVAAALIPRSAHYVSDVAVGALIGLLAEALANSVWRPDGRQNVSA